ncbi:hypothetical protein SBRY_10074 [Actinacidiphila bryophytorum]|uniref:Uncharacterized protein n=1 Tax=Actinacidiphila bryophytorum TaxID=1436133 RepID=A0A9W4E5N0_9ACTN|nr:hypothetical protein SBRY_10074 [Actinacidiphila bryophytorum]
MGGQGVLPRPARARRPPRDGRPLPPERRRLLPRHGASLRGHRSQDRGDPRPTPLFPGAPRARAHLHLRGRRPGRDRRPHLPLAREGTPRGRGELRAQPPPGARVVTDPKGLFGPCRTTGRWWVARAVPRAPEKHRPTQGHPLLGVRSHDDGPSPHQGRGELRAQPPPGARVVTDPKGLFGPETDHRPMAG